MSDSTELRGMGVRLTHWPSAAKITTTSYGQQELNYLMSFSSMLTDAVFLAWYNLLDNTDYNMENDILIEVFEQETGTWVPL